MNLRFKLGSARRVVLVTAVVLLLFGLGATRASASPLDPNGTDWEGLSELVAIAQGELGKDRVVATAKLDFGTLDRADALVLVHPERRIEADELSSFMRQGGRVILLDDYGSGDGLLAYFGIQRVPLPGRPALMLRDNPALAIAESSGRHASFRDADRVVLNHATGLARASLSPLLVVRGEGEPDVLLALAGDVGLGNFIAVGDSSVAMNSMLRYPGNRALAFALVRYAMQTRASPNPGKLYVLVNDFDLAGGYGTPHGGPLGQAYQTVARGLQELRTDGLSPTAAYALALAGG
ncbi:MAG TPA: DUF4350 domain-containing protein, partial [Polyangiaceae bacterium]|nr:DUF4350 domain-containing protein [Polyangiaceae bacterium]